MIKSEILVSACKDAHLCDICVVVCSLCLFRVVSEPSSRVCRALLVVTCPTSVPRGIANEG